MTLPSTAAGPQARSQREAQEGQRSAASVNVPYPPGRLLLRLFVQPQAVIQLNPKIYTFLHVESQDSTDNPLSLPQITYSCQQFFVFCFSTKQAQHSGYWVRLTGLAGVIIYFKKFQRAGGIAWHPRSEAQPKNKWSFSPSLPTRHGNESKFKNKDTRLPSWPGDASAKSQRGTDASLNKALKCTASQNVPTLLSSFSSPSKGQGAASPARSAPFCHTENGSLVNISTFRNIKAACVMEDDLARFSSKVTTARVSSPQCRAAALQANSAAGDKKMQRQMGAHLRLKRLVPGFLNRTGVCVWINSG